LNPKDDASNYFAMLQVVTETTASITRPPELPPHAEIWWTGARLGGSIDLPLRYEIDEEDEGELGSYLNESAPLLAEPLVNAMSAAGVTNIEVFDAVLRETRTSTEHSNYKAVNIVGIIKGADPSASDIESLEGLGSWVRRFRLDESVAKGELVFRLRESPSVVVVHRRVRDALLSVQPMLLEFVDMRDFRP
jgi:hypothetical protein